MSKRIWSIALAYIGVMIGAGVSSGQDLLQYFVSFGVWGLIGVIVLSVLHVGILYSGHCSDYHMLSFWFCYDGRCRG